MEHWHADVLTIVREDIWQSKESKTIYEKYPMTRLVLASVEFGFRFAQQIRAQCTVLFSTTSAILNLVHLQ
jgi:hypothetical protein